jgi:hypothetical protein
MSTSFSGGCACGAVRYECSVEPMMSLNCHCRDCQRASGSAFAAVMAVPKAAVTITGEPKFYEVQAESAHTVGRGFCATCGSPLFITLSAWPEIISIRAASLDDPSYYRPASDIWTDSAQPWDYMNPELPKFPKGPQR